MTAPTTTTTGVDVDFKDPTIIAESAASGTAGTGLPTVGSNQVARWELWDPNRWWTDWRIPPKPQATWERWFDWIKQLRSQVPAIRAAADDWRTLTGQLDAGLQSVRRQRPELATWTGPTGRTMAQALDNLETATRTRADAIRGNPVVLEDLARTIEDAVGPMTALDGEYQQVLTNDTQCRAVALRGAPIMLGVADKLLTAGNALQNSARDETRAPMAAPVQPLVLRDGPEGPAGRLAQVAGSAGNADPGAVTPGTVVQPPAQPTVAAADQTGGGAVTQAGALPRAALPGVVAAPGGAGADPGMVTAGGVVQPGTQPTVSIDHTTAGSAAAGTGATAATTGRADLPDVMLAGGSAGPATPAAPAGWGGGGLSGGAATPGGGAMPGPAGAPGSLPMMAGGAASGPAGAAGPLPMAAGAAGAPGAVGAAGAAGAARAAGASGIAGAAGAAAVVPGPGSGAVLGAPGGAAADRKRKRERERDEPEGAFLIAPVPVGPGASGRVGVPGGLLGRTGGAGGARAVPVARATRRRRDPDRTESEDAELLDAEAWRSGPPAPGPVSARDR